MKDNKNSVFRLAVKTMKKLFSIHRIFSLTSLLVLLLLFLIVGILVLASVPPVSRDALTHHLAIPKLYLSQGGIRKMPGVLFSFYPMNLELLYMVPLYFGNDIVPKYIHFSFALMTAVLIFLYLKKRINIRYALLGGLFFLSVPIMVKLSITAYVDLGLVFFSTASLFFFLRWIEARFGLKDLILSAVFCGLALGTKYNGLIVFLLLALFVPFVYSRVEGSGRSASFRALKFSLIFMAMALLVFSPWMVRNYRWTNNPIYPLYQSWFQNRKMVLKPAGALQRRNSRPAAAEAHKKRVRVPLEHFSYRRIIYQESWWQIGLVPLRIFFQGEDDNPRRFDGKLNPLLLFFPLFAFWGWRRDPLNIRLEKGVFFFFVLFFILFAFFKINMRIRYIVPIVPPLIVLSIFGLARMEKIFPEKRKGLAKLAVAAGVAFYMGLNGHYVMSQFKYVDPISYLSGQKSREAYIEVYRGEFPVFDYANKNLPKQAKLLRVFLGNRIYFSDRKTIAGINLFYRALKDAGGPEKIAEGLKKKGITHMIVRHDLFDRWTADNLNDLQKQMVQRFFGEHARLLFFKNGYGLFQI